MSHGEGPIGRAGRGPNQRRAGKECRVPIENALETNVFFKRVLCLFVVVFFYKRHFEKGLINVLEFLPGFRQTFM